MARSQHIKLIVKRDLEEIKTEADRLANRRQYAFLALLVLYIIAFAITWSLYEGPDVGVVLVACFSHAFYAVPRIFKRERSDTAYIELKRQRREAMANKLFARCGLSA